MPEERQITDDMLLSELTVGEFRQLIQSMFFSKESASKIEPPIEKVNIRRKSLDEFMDDLGGKK
jgi:hypothetical protein